MSYWRPSSPSFYVIPDIHGRKHELELILKRITPLRKYDKIIFLGDYIDRGVFSKEVIDIIIDLKKSYPEQIVTILGNHEWLMLASLGAIDVHVPKEQVSPFAVWMSNGAPQTIYSYAKNKLTIDDCFNTTPNIVSKYIPSSHIDFMLDCPLFFETNDYIFVHAGCDPRKPLENQSNDVFLWDRSLFESCIINSENNLGLFWKKTVVCGHSYVGPLLLDKYYMLDGSKKNRLYCMELFSKELYYAETDNLRLVKSDYANYQKYKGGYSFKN